MTIYGYARVSSRDQNPARQLETLREFPVADCHIYIDHQSGKDFARPAWQELTNRCRKGDTIVVHSLDRLGRSYTEVVREWKNSHAHAACRWSFWICRSWIPGMNIRT